MGAGSIGDWQVVLVVAGSGSMETAPQRNTGRSCRQNAVTGRSTRWEERVSVQGPVKKSQADGMSHRGLPLGCLNIHDSKNDPTGIQQPLLAQTGTKTDLLCLPRHIPAKSYFFLHRFSISIGLGTK